MNLVQNTALKKLKRSVALVKVTSHKYYSFSEPEQSMETEVKVLFWIISPRIANILMSGEPTGDYKCKLCGTNFHPDYLD